MKFLLIFLGIIVPGLASACECANVDDDEVYAAASTVFLARIVRAELVPAPDGRDIGRYETVRATFEVVEVFKGDPGSIKAVESSGRVDGMCFSQMWVGDHYLIYGGANPIVHISSCTSSRRFDDADEAEWLQKHRVPK